MSEDPYFNKADITLTRGHPVTGHFVDGHINADPRYTFSAKIFDLGSHFGIDNGRISKLEISRDGEMVGHYDRGWDLVPKSTQDKAALATIVSAFPPLAQELIVEDEKRPSGKVLTQRFNRNQEHER